MIGAITLASILGTWSCVARDETPRSTVAYTFTAEHTGRYTKRVVGILDPDVRRFTFEFFGGREEATVVERLVRTGTPSFKELHLVNVSGRHMVDRGVGYWRDDGEYATYPTQETLDCVR